MTKTQKMFGIAAVTVFTLFAVLTPGLFAQAPSQSGKTSSQNQLYIEMVRNVFSLVLENYVDEVDPEVLYKGALEGLLDSLGDPYTEYLDMSEQRNLTDTTSGQFGGVGLQITKANVSTADKPAYVEVSNPIEGTPGWRAGIQAGDLLIAINGISTPDITMEEVLALLRGKVGTSVEVTVSRSKAGKTMEFTVTLERAIIEVPTVKYGMIDDGGSTGYLRIIEFTPLTAERVQDALDFFATQNYDSLIIDLRNNPGGLLASVEDVADKFIDEGVIVSTRGRNPRNDYSYYASPRKTTMPKNIPIVALINGGSASASEILSGALKDTRKAYLVGENTYGKGLVQQPFRLPYNDGFKITTARYYTPSGSNIDKIGIPPDLEVLFADLTDEEAQAYVELMNANVIAEYVEAHEDMTEGHIAEYANTLAKDYALDTRLLRRLIRLSVNRYKGDELYDLDYDVQLITALETVRRSDFNTLVNSSKTLKQIEEENAAKEKMQEEEPVAFYR